MCDENYKKVQLIQVDKGEDPPPEAEWYPSFEGVYTVPADDYVEITINWRIDM